MSRGPGTECNELLITNYKWSTTCKSMSELLTLLSLRTFE